jgi:hypothetical protein
VVFVLGAPEERQSGVGSWAGWEVAWGEPGLELYMAAGGVAASAACGMNSNAGIFIPKIHNIRE